MRSEIRKTLEDVSHYGDQIYFKIPHDYAPALINNIEMIADENAINFARYVIINLRKFRGEHIIDIYEQYKKL